MSSPLAQAALERDYYKRNGCGRLQERHLSCLVEGVTLTQSTDSQEHLQQAGD